MTVSDDRKFLDGLEAGDWDCAGEVTEKFRPQLIAAAAALLPKHLRRRVDPEDVVQLAYTSFWVALAREKYRFGSLAEVHALLHVIVVDKVRETVREHCAACRDASHEVQPDDSDPTAQPVSREDDPAETASALDLLTNAEKRLSLIDQIIMHVRRDGWNVDDIAETVGRSRRFVSEALAHVRAALRELDPNVGQDG